MVDTIPLEPQFRYRKFSAAECECITKIGQQSVRNWRRLGYLPSYFGKHASFFPKDVLEIWVFDLMTKSGISPSATKRYANHIAALVMDLSERNPNAMLADMDACLFKPIPGGTARYVVIFPSGIIGLGGDIASILTGCGTFTRSADSKQIETGDLAMNAALVVLDIETLAAEFVARSGALWVPNPLFIKSSGPARTNGKAQIALPCGRTNRRCSW